MNPLELLYSWQALLIAIAATGITQLVKTVIDVAWGHKDAEPTPTMKDAKRVGEALRKRNLIINRLVLPMTPIWTGALMAVLIPIRPEAIITYIAEQHIEGAGRLLVFAAWGAACGQFADYGFNKVKAALKGTPSQTEVG
jgi:hypothetical protein